MTAEKAILFDADACNGCRICELACSMSREGEYNPKKSLIKVTANEEAGIYIPIHDIRCDFCGRCAGSCPTGALNIVTIEEAITVRKGASMGTFPIPVSSLV